MRRVKEILNTAWDYIWELVMMMFFGAVGILIVPLLIIGTIIVSFYSRETPADACDILIEGLKEMITKKNDE